MLFEFDRSMAMDSGRIGDQAQLEKESLRIYYLRIFIMAAIAAFENREISPRLISFMSTVLQGYMESGGTAGETFTRLVGIGVLKDFVVTAIVKLDYRKAEDDKKKIIPEPEIVITSGEDGGIEARIKLYFEARVPDDEGRERWGNFSNPFSLCSASFVMPIEANKINHLKEINAQLRDDFDKIGDSMS